METVLIFGASSNVGVSAVFGALHRKLNVLAIVSDQAEADELLQHFNTTRGITVVEADITDEDAMLDVVEKVKTGDLPAFQHVYSSVGFLNPKIKIQDTATTFRNIKRFTVDANIFAYRATVPYLIQQPNIKPTWTLLTGAPGESGTFGVISVAQRALFTLADTACRQNANTSLRFNEVHLACRVEYDSVCERQRPENCRKASEFALVYEGILANEDIDGCRISVYGLEDMFELRYEKKLRGH